MSRAAVRRRCRRDAPRWKFESGRAQRTPASGKGLVFSPESFLQDQLVERQLRPRPLEPAVFLLQFPEALGLVELQTAVLAPPAIITLLRDAKTSADGANRLALSETDLRFPQKTDDLLCRDRFRAIPSSPHSRLEIAGFVQSAWHR